MCLKWTFITFNKESSPSSSILHTTGIFTFIIGSAVLDVKNALLSVPLKFVSKTQIEE